MSVTALQLHEEDHVASVLADVDPGDEIRVKRPDGSSYVLHATGPIPFGHKVALTALPSDTLILKYGAPIGQTTRRIEVGDHVHVHNVAGLAGKGSTGQTIKAMPPEPAVTFDPTQLQEWVESVSAASGLHADAARDLAEAIIDAELCGVTTHGLRRLPSYLDRVASKSVDGQATPVLTGDGSLIEVDGHNSVGAHVLRVTTDAVASRALRHGVCLGLVRNSSHAGAIGWAASRLADRGLVAIVISNGPPLVAPPQGATPFISNSPIAISAPMLEGDVFLVDMATSVTSRDQVRQAAEKGTAIPLGWALDSAGAPTQSAEAAMAGTMLPMGGARGFALILGLEVLSALLPGAQSDILVASKESGNSPEGIGHFVLAVNPGHLTTGSTLVHRLAQMEERMTALKRPDSAAEPRLPGRRRSRLRSERRLSGVRVAESLERRLRELARNTGCKLPDTVRSAS